MTRLGTRTLRIIAELEDGAADVVREILQCQIIKCSANNQLPD